MAWHLLRIRLPKEEGGGSQEAAPPSPLHVLDDLVPEGFEPFAVEGDWLYLRRTDPVVIEIEEEEPTYCGDCVHRINGECEIYAVSVGDRRPSCEAHYEQR